MLSQTLKIMIVLKTMTVSHQIGIILLNISAH